MGSPVLACEGERCRWAPEELVGVTGSGRGMARSRHWWAAECVSWGR